MKICLCGRCVCCGCDLRQTGRNDRYGIEDERHQTCRCRADKETGLPRLNVFDGAVHRKIARGRLHIEAHVDLHDLTQGKPIRCFCIFCNQHGIRDMRHVLVITGKGTSFGRDGILRGRLCPIGWRRRHFVYVS